MLELSLASSRQIRFFTRWLCLATAICLGGIASPAWAQPNPSCVTVPDGIVSWWQAEDNAEDRVDENDGVLFNGATFTNGMVGQAFLLGGSGAHVRVPHDPAMNPTNELTLETWIYPSSDSSTYRMIFSTWDYAAGRNQRGYGLGIYPNGRAYITISPEGVHGFSAVSTSGIQAGRWTHVAGTYDGATLRMFLDGVLEDEVAYTGGMFGGTNDLGIGGTVGGTAEGVVSYTFTGLIDEPSVYNRSVSSEEIATIYNAGSAGKCEPEPPLEQGLIAYYPFDDGTADDATGHGHDGAVNGASWSTQGVLGGSFSFNGTDDHIRIADHPDLNPEQFTVTHWVKLSDPSDIRGSFAKSRAFGSSLHRVLFLPNDDIAFSIRVNGDQSGELANPFAAHLDAWAMVTVIYTGTHTRMYINDQLVGELPLAAGTLVNGDDVLIGAGSFNSDGETPTQLFQGDIDEVRLYNRELSTAEVALLYERTLEPPSDEWLVNVDFGSDGSATDGASSKVGPAAFGQSSIDFWNFYNNPWNTFGAVTNLLQADGNTTQVGMTVVNAPGAYGPPSDDPMYGAFIYPQDGGNITVNVTNLPAGDYDFVVYSYDGNYELLVDGVSQGVEQCREWPIVNPPVWQEGTQYVLFEQVSVGAGQDVELIVRQGLDGSAIIAGIQIRGSMGGPEEAPNIVSQPQDQSVPEGGVALFTVAAEGPAPLSYQWFHDQVTLAGQTEPELVLSNVQPAQAGAYSVVVSNVAGIVTSSNAVLTVVPAPPPGDWLVNVDFFSGLAGVSPKVGEGATGQDTNDFWNFYSRTAPDESWLSFGVLTNLLQADGTPTTVGLAVANATGAWFSSSDDPMYRTYIYPYPPSTGNATLTLTNLPAGDYDFYVYSYDGNYELLVDGVSQGVEQCRESPVVNPPNWQEGTQYVLFEQVSVSAGQDVQLIVRQGQDGYAIISGLQIQGFAASPPPCALPDNIVSWWQAESNALDRVGDDDGTLVNGTTFAPGKVGQAFSFDGINDSVSFGNTAGNFGSNDFSIDFWVRTTNTTRIQSLLSKRPICGFASLIDIRLGGSVAADHGLVTAAISQDTSGNNLNRLQSTTRVNDGVFHHVAFVREGTLATLYVDGVLEDSDATPGITIISNGSELVAGRSPCVTSADGTKYFKGELDELTLFGRALTAPEIATIYNAGSAGKCEPEPPLEQGLIAYYPFDDGTADDATGHGHDGAVNGASWSTQGVLGGSFSFDGTDDHIRIADHPDLNPDQFTVTHWVKLSDPSDIRGSFAKSRAFGSSLHRVLFLPNDDIAFSIRVNGDQSGELANPFAAHLDAWTMVTVIYTGTHTRMYVNDQLVGELPLAAGTLVNGEDVLIGAGTFNSDGETPTQLFQGDIDEVRLYNRELSMAEVALLYERTLEPPSDDWLVNVDFGASTTASLKSGTAAVGQNTNDFWNFYTRDDGAGGYSTIGTLTNLLQADGTPTDVGLTVANAPGAWYISSDDPMYRTYIYPLNGGNVTISITNLLTGHYNFFIYAYDGNYELLVDGISQGVEQSREWPIINPPDWQEGTHYVLFEQVSVGAGQDVQLIVRKGLDNYAVIAGMQIKSVGERSATPPSIVTQPQGGTVNEGDSFLLTVQADGTPTLDYQWLKDGTEVNGATNVSLDLNPVEFADAGTYAVLVSNAFGTAMSLDAVLDVNRLPIADASATLPLVVSPNNTNATVVLNGTLSFDPDGDPLIYSWRRIGDRGPLATGIVAMIVLPVGIHTIQLTVSDSMASDTDSIVVEVITLAEAADRLLEAVTDSGSGNGQSLIASLRAAIASIDRSQPISAINQLQAFQYKVLTQVAPEDPALAAEFIQQAQEIIESLAEGELGSKNLKALANQTTGNVQVEFSGSAGKTYVIEASTDMVNWQMIGVARHNGNGQFDFEDPQADEFPCRFYRVVTP